MWTGESPSFTECLGLPRAELVEPKLSIGAFTQRCKKLAVCFGHALGQTTGQIAFAPEFSSAAAMMTLAGRASETIARNRGRPHCVLPLCRITGDVLAWIGYRERWQKQGAEQSFRFVESGFTLHAGREGDPAKPQILRSEWIGSRSGAFVNQAGQPHWQLDVLESARAHTPEPPTRFNDLTAARPALEFDAMHVPEVREDVLFGLTIERMHLASAALWWRQPSVPVVHPPETVADIDRWILGCVTYLRQEVGRCTIVDVPAYLAM
jgi:hypothetical protein